MLPEMSQAKAVALQFLVERMVNAIDEHTSADGSKFYPELVFSRVGSWAGDARKVLADA